MYKSRNKVVSKFVENSQIQEILTFSGLDYIIGSLILTTTGINLQSLKFVKTYFAWTDVRTDPNYRKASLLKINFRVANIPI